MAAPHEVLAELLQAVNRELFEQVKDVFEKYGLPSVGMVVMMHQIREEPGITLSELSRRTGLAKSHISRMIDSLSEQGYVDKRPDPADQRLIRLHASLQADAHFARLQEDMNQRLAVLVAPIPEAELAALIDGLQTLRSTLERLKTAPTPG